jgi:3-methyladenine DNA glycosylase AlkC
MAEKILLKDQLFNRGGVERVAREIAAVHPGFDVEGFVGVVVEGFPALELKQRIDWMAASLAAYLPRDYREAVGILLRALPPPSDPALGDGDYGDFLYAPYSRLVADRGCNASDLAFSLGALCEITTRFSAEDAIRPFLNTFPDETLAVLLAWRHHPHYHVRRLCSEGSRPRLPWAGRLAIPRIRALPILDALYADPTRYVTRSVANHVNDIAKDDPDLALDLLERWRGEGRQAPGELDFIIRHATRSLVKQGNARAMALLGVSADAAATVRELVCPPAVALGDVLEFVATVTTAEDADLIIDFAIAFPGPTGRIGRKVFKLVRAQSRAGTPLAIRHAHRMRAGMTTRRIVPGTHRLELLINGRSAASASFDVIEEETDVGAR